MTARDPTQPRTADERIIDEARRRFKRVHDHESKARTNWTDDVKFGMGDSVNGWQWNQDVAAERGDRPTLTINRTRQFCLQIINDARQNKASVEVRPVGNGATYEAAKVFEGVVRHIEYISNAQAAYDTATWCQVFGGIGWWRIATDWVGDSFDQEIYIKRIADPLSVYLDPDIQEYDGSDARWGFVVRDVARDQFELDYPQYDDDDFDAGRGSGARPTLGEGDAEGWDDEHHVRIAEYWRKTEKSDVLHHMIDGSARRESEMDPDMLAAMPPGLSVRQRDVARVTVEYFKIVGSRIVERSTWAGNFIPLIRVVGEETFIDGELDRRGHVRFCADPARMYNYWTSAATEFVALQGKTPWIAATGAIEGYVNVYENANTENLAFLPFNAFDDQGRPQPKPERAQPPVMAAAYMDGMKTASEEMMFVTGQYQADLGMPSNEKSGKAIQERQRSGDNATYHFIDHISLAIRHTGRQLVDLIPKIYDTSRVIQILGLDGSQTAVQLDPNAQASHQQVQDPDDDGYDPQQVAAIFNPSVGVYDVECDIGPAYATRRQEAFNAFQQIIQASPDLVHIAGDLMFKAADFPMADELAERLKNMVPPQALGQGPDPQVQQLTQQLQAAQMHLQGMQRELAMAKSHAVATGEKNEIENYKAETDRLKAIGTVDPMTLQMIVRQLWEQMQGTPIAPELQRHAAIEQTLQPPPDPGMTNGSGGASPQG